MSLLLILVTLGGFFGLGLAAGLIGLWIKNKIRKKQKHMTQVADICYALLNGRTLSIMTAFKDFHCTNLPREISRAIEKKFEVTVERQRVDFTSTYGRGGYYFRYMLRHTKENEIGITKMKKYVSDNLNTNPKTDKEAKVLKQAKLILQ